MAIDRPGYGNSSAIAPTQTMEDHAFVLAQVAAQLREGSYALEGAEPRAYDRVVGMGHSMGAFAVMVAQGEHAPFDAIVPIGWSHGGFRDEFRACANGSGPCPEGMDILLYRDNADPRIWSWFENLTGEPNPGTLVPQFIVQTGCWDCFDPALAALRALPDPDDVPASRIAVPVLMLLGVEDGFVGPATEAEERAVMTSATDVTVVNFERTAHFVWHHLNHEDVFGAAVSWLDERGL